MMHLREPIFFNINHLARFFACFGMIDHVILNIPRSLVPPSIRDELKDIPIFHTGGVEFQTNDQTVPDSQDFSYDHVFLALMSSCRSLKQLNVQVRYLKTSTLIAFAYMCHHRQQPLSLISYPLELELENELEHSLPYLHLEPW
jgi:hypothetical protein